MLVGDIIEAINGEPVSGKDARDIEKLISESGMECVLKLQRPAQKEVRFVAASNFECRIKPETSYLTAPAVRKLGIRFQVKPICVCLSLIDAPRHQLRKETEYQSEILRCADSYAGRNPES